MGNQACLIQEQVRVGLEGEHGATHQSNDHQHALDLNQYARTP